MKMAPRNSFLSWRRADAPGPLDQIGEQLANQFFRRLVLEVSRLVEPFGGIADHHFGLIDWKHIEKNESLPEMIPRPRCADPAN